MADGGLGLAAPASGSQLSTADPRRPAAVASATRKATAAQQPKTAAAQTPSGLTLETNPLAAIGLILSNISAGMQGQPLPSDALIKRRQQQQQLNLQRLKLGQEAVKTALSLSNALDPVARADFFDTYARQFSEVMPGLRETLEKATAFPDIDIVIDALGEHGEIYSILNPSGDPDNFLAMASNPVLRKSLDDAADFRNREVVAAKLQTIGQMLQVGAENAQLDISGLPTSPSGSPTLTMGQLEVLNGKLADNIRMSPSELGTLRRNPGLAASLGFEIEATSIAAQKAAAVEAAAPSTDFGRAIKLLNEAGDDADKTKAALDMIEQQTSGGQTDLVKRFRQLDKETDPARRSEIQAGIDKLVLPAAEALSKRMVAAAEAGNIVLAERLNDNLKKLTQPPEDLGGLQDARVELEEIIANPDASPEAVSDATRRLAETEDAIKKDVTITGRTAEDVADKAAAREKVKTEANFTDQMLDKTLEIRTVSGVLRQAKSEVGVSGARGALASAIGGVAGQISQPFGEAVQNIISGGASGEDITAFRTNARLLVAQMIPEVSGEQSGRFSEMERAITESTLRALRPEASKEQVVTAISELMAFKIIGQDFARIRSGRNPEFDLDTLEGTEAALENYIKLGLSPTRTLQLIQDLDAMRKDVQSILNLPKG